jgi:uncharacterized membrane protein YgdD (TMEM256/DUF423 family)
MKLSIIALVGSVFVFLGVMFGALASHFLAEKISPESIQSFRIATRYMLFHGLALLFLPALPYLTEPQKLNAGLCLVIGTVLFSWSILLLSTKSWHGVTVALFGPITPLGGLFLLAGWGYVIVQLWRAL